MTRAVLDVVLELRRAGDWNSVERVCAAEFVRDPRNAEIAWQLADAQWRRHDPVAAEATMRVADRFTPGNGNVVTALGWFAAEQARYDAARRFYERALTLGTSDLEASIALAELELRRGDWQRGWARYESRLKRTDRAPNSSVSIMGRVAPQWTGQSLADRTLLVYSEQGCGDDIQMMRFIDELGARAREQGGQLVLACRRALHSLFSRHYGPCVEIEGDYAQHGRPDYCLPMMSVPFALRLRPGNVCGKPYLRPDTFRLEQWRSRVRDATPLREALQIGLVWRGSPTHRRDTQRSMQLEELAPLLALNDLVFHPLTPGHTSLPASAPHCDLTKWYLDGFDDVAAHVATLDAVVTIDSAPLHLGGALGVPVYAMLDHVSHWCWGKGETQRWYDSVTLFRQPKPGAWQPVIVRVADQLKKLIAGRKSEAMQA